MSSVYILYSESLDRYYIGSCLNLDERLEEHRNKKYANSFTSKADDWKLFFSLSNLEYAQSRKIEMHIKRMKSKKYIENLNLHQEISQKLIEKYKSI